jgi:hypothetical protein
LISRAYCSLISSTKINAKEQEWAFLGMGILTTIPIVVGIIGKRPAAEEPVALAA